MEPGAAAQSMNYHIEVSPDFHNLCFAALKIQEKKFFFHLIRVILVHRSLNFNEEMLQIKMSHFDGTCLGWIARHFQGFRIQDFFGSNYLII